MSCGIGRRSLDSGLIAGPGTPEAGRASNNRGSMSARTNTPVPLAKPAFERLMRQYNQRLFRVARSILRDDADAEDALQDAYVQAYRKLDDFRGEAELGTWLTRIVINQALMRARKRRRDRVVVPFGAGREHEAQVTEVADEMAESPSDAAMRGEVRKVIERRIDELPDEFRTVFRDARGGRDDRARDGRRARHSRSDRAHAAFPRARAPARCARPRSRCRARRRVRLRRRTLRS